MFKTNKITYFFASTIFLLLAFVCTGCQEDKVTITKDYVINPNWNEISNAFQVIRMNLKDSSNINLKNVTPPELLKKLVEDTSFSFVTNVKYNGEDYSKRKVYFNRYNGFLWGKLNDRHSNYEQETIGELQQNTWYLLIGLSNVKTLYYVYIDSKDSIYTFKVSSQHWTNY